MVNKDNIRAFIAVEIDSQAAQKIAGLVFALKKSEADVKWITEDQTHLTLKFLGNVDQGKIEEITSALSSVSSNFKSFTIRFSNIGAFPNLDKPRVIWLGIDKGADDLKKLSLSIENALEKLGFEKETRGFVPHLTLGRVKTLWRLSKLKKLINETHFDSEITVQINKITLFQSELNPKGAIYSKLSTASFK